MHRQLEMKPFNTQQNEDIMAITNHKTMTDHEFVNLGSFKLLHFTTQEAASLTLTAIKLVLGNAHPALMAHCKVVPSQINSDYFCFGLSASQYSNLQKKIPEFREAKRKVLREKARTIKPESDFYFKMLRADLDNYYNYYFPFVNELIDSNKNPFPKRAGVKGNFTVTGEGVFSRKKHFSHLAPFKKNQYTKDEKKGFTNFQSATLGMPGYFPIPCEFNYKKEVLAGIMLDEKDVLLSNRLYVSDAETYHRPYDFVNLENAQEYYKKNKDHLYSKKNLNAYKDAIRRKNVNFHNESLIRMRLNCNDGSFKTSIMADNLESRLQAKQYAISLEAKLKQLKLCPDHYTVLTVYYTPNDSQLLFREYTDAEYLLDCHEAASIYVDVAMRIKKYQEGRFEFLVGLSSEILKEALKGKISAQAQNTLALTLLKKGKIFIFRVLQEKTQSSLDEILGSALDMTSEEDKLSIFNHALLADNEELTEYIYGKLNLGNIQKGTKLINDSLQYALKKKKHHWFDKLLASNKIDLITPINSNGDTFLHVAACEKDPAYMKSLLKFGSNIDVQNNVGNTPLMLSAANGHTKTLQAILDNEIAPDVNLRNHHGDTALIYAADKGKSKALAVLKNNKKTNIFLKNKEGRSALYFAVKNRDHKNNELLLENPFTTDSNLTSLYNNSSLNTRSLIMAVIFKDTETVKILQDKANDFDAKNKIVKMLFKAGKIINNAGICKSNFENQSWAHKIACYFDEYAHPPLFSFTYRHHKALAKKISNHLRSNSSWTLQECIHYINIEMNGIKLMGAFGGLFYLLKQESLNNIATISNFSSISSLTTPKIG